MRRSLAFLLLLLVLPGCGLGNSYLIPFKRYVIPQNGMFPNLPAESSFWVIHKPLVIAEGIQRGDIIVFRDTIDGRSYYFVWRVVGIPGDEIVIEGTSISINQKKLIHTRISEDSEHLIIQEQNGTAEYLVAYKKKADQKSRPTVSRVVPTDSFFVLGDNRDAANDSRFTGEVSFNRLVGRKLWN